MEKHLRILHLRKSAGYYGAERVIVSLASGLYGAGHLVWIGCLYDSRSPNMNIIDKAKVLGLLTIIFYCDKTFDLKTIKQIYYFVKKCDIDILHTHGFKADIYGWIVAKLTNKQIIATKHGWTKSNRLIRFWEKLDLLFLRSFDKIVVVSEEMKKHLSKQDQLEGKVHVIQNGIDIETSGRFNANSLRNSLGIASTNVVVGIVGRLSIEKNHRFFIDVAKYFAERNHNIKFLIVGDGILREELEDYAKKLNLQNTIFTGHRSNVTELFNIIDIVLSTSVREGVPIALLEAMAAKKPIVATSVGGVKTIVMDGETGFLVPLDNFTGFVKRVQLLVENKKLRNSFGKNGYQFLQKHYSSNKMVSEYTSVYDELINQ